MNNHRISVISRMLVAGAVLSGALALTSVPGAADTPRDCAYPTESDLSTFVSLDYDESVGALRFGGQVTCYGGGDLGITELWVTHVKTLSVTHAPVASCQGCERVSTSALIASDPGYYQVVMRFQVNGGEILTRSSDFFHTGFGEPFQSCTALAEASVWGCFT